MATDYVTVDDLKSTLQITATGSDVDLINACAAASRAIEVACGRRFWQDADANQVRYYTSPVPYGYYQGAYSNAAELDIDDLTTLTSLTLDLDGDGVYETTWTNGTQFYLDPRNAAADNYPFERIVLRQKTGVVFPAWPNAVKVTGKFGWPEIPPQVTEYAGIFAAQLYLRSRQAPFGVVSAGIEIGSTTRISRFDPDFDRLLGNLVKPNQLIA